MHTLTMQPPCEKQQSHVYACDTCNADTSHLFPTSNPLCIRQYLQSLQSLLCCHCRLIPELGNHIGQVNLCRLQVGSRWGQGWVAESYLSKPLLHLRVLWILTEPLQTLNFSLHLLDITVALVSLQLHHLPMYFELT